MLYSKKYVLLSILTILGIYSYIVYSNYIQNKNSLLHTIRENQIQLVKAYKTKIDAKLLQKKRIITSTANYIKKKDRQQDYSLIKEVLALTIVSGNFRSVYIGYHDNYFITGINWVAPEWYNVTKREWYKQVQETQQLVVTKPYMDSDLDSNVISIATPIFKNNELFAVLSSDIKIDDFKYDMLSLMPIKEGFAFMISKSGDVILQPENFGFNIKSSALKAINKEFLNSTSGVKTYSIKEKNYIFTYDSLQNSDWMFITVLDEKKIYEKLENELFKNLVIAALLLFIGILTSLYLSSTQRKLFKNRKLLDLFAKSSSWGVLMTDKKGKIVFVNKSYENIFNLKSKSLYNQNILSAVHSIENKEFFKENKPFFIQAQTNPKEILSYKLQSEHQTFNFQVTPLLKGNEDFEGIIVTVYDITRETLIEKEHLSQEKIFIQNSKMIALGEMVNAISHQWKQPLSTLLLLISNLEERILNKDFEKVEDYLVRSRSNIVLMSETVEAFRNFYKEDTCEKEFNLIDTIEEVTYIISPLLTIKGIHLQFNYEGNKDAFMLLGFSAYLKQVLINLVTNAKDSLVTTLKNDPFYEAHIVIDLEKTPFGFTLCIEDNGEGIEENKVQEIFDPTFTTKGKAGTGTGLHLSKLLIEDKMHGKLYLKNNKAPTTFVIELKDTHA